jgi:hypothetical protein
MVEKLCKLKQQQIDQQLLLKQQVLSKIDDIDKELVESNYQFENARIQPYGRVSDVVSLQLYKEDIKDYMVELHKTKIELKKTLEYFDKTIMALNKEYEQFNYLLEEQKREKLKQIQKDEDLVASEYMQVKFIQNMQKNGEKVV